MFQTIGEGMERPDQLPALRLTASGLLEWLEKRGKVSQTWRRRQPTIRKAVDSALEAIAEKQDVYESLTKLNHISYYDCKNAFEQLKKTEPTSKTLLGKYTSLPLRTMDYACNAFLRDNCHIADAAEELRDLLKHEIKEANKRIEADNERCSSLREKISTGKNYAEKLHAEFEKACADWGVIPDCESKSFVAQLAEVPAIMLADAVRGIIKCFVDQDSGSQSVVVNMIDCFDAFDLFARRCGETEKNGCNDDADDNKPLLTLRTILKTRNMSVKAAVALLSHCCGSKQADVMLKIQNSDRLQLLHMEHQKKSDDIVNTINWDISGGDELEGDFGIVVEDEGNAEDDDNAGSVVGIVTEEDDDMPDETENGFNGLLKALLHDKLLRASVVNDLWELKEFFTQRRTELAEDAKLQVSSASNTAINFYSATGNKVPELSMSDAEQFIRAIDFMLDALESSRTKGLIEIQESAHTLERVSQSLVRKMQQAEYQNQVVSNCQQSLDSMDEVIEKDQRTLDDATQRARFLTQALKSTLIELFPNRDIILTMV